MAKGGRLEALCHHTYEALLLRSRGYGMSKAVLDAVAGEEGLNLKALVARLGRTPGATRDYLQWLVGVDAIRMEGKRYFYVDGLVRWWVRLHATGHPASVGGACAARSRSCCRPLRLAAAATAAEPVSPARPPRPPGRSDGDRLTAQSYPTGLGGDLERRRSKMRARGLFGT